MPKTITCNHAAAQEHVGKIELEICVIKEQGRSTIKTLPFKICPCQVIIELLYVTVLWINAIPIWETGISAIYSPREIINGMKIDFKKHCKLDFGKYVEAHDEPTPTNGMKSHIIPCVALGPTGNLQGTYKFMDINTGMNLEKRS